MLDEYHWLSSYSLHVPIPHPDFDRPVTRFLVLLT
jgi:hypothetical protein